MQSIEHDRRVQRISRAQDDGVRRCVSGIMMLEHLGWATAGERIVRAMEKTIAQKTVTYDFARLTDGAKEVRAPSSARAS